MMVNSTSSVQADIDLLNFTDAKIKNRLKKLSSAPVRHKDLDGLAQLIFEQLAREEKTLEKIGLCLTPIHREEHRKIIREIALLEFSWEAKRISDEVYIKSINYKLEFHEHYFDKAQRMLMLAAQDD